MSGVRIITLRPGAPEDADACAVILSDWITETPWFPDLHGRVQDRAFVAGKIDGGEVIVAETGGAVAGFLARDGDWVGCLYVAAAARGRGVGRARLDAAKAAHPEGLRLWTFQANAGARRFYAREGFVETAETEGDNEEGLPDVELRWKGAP